jgi:hypothetical protein
MKEDYLWDKTGEADADVRRLEALLGGLRYEPRRLALPAKPVQVSARREAYLFPALRLAAVAAIALLALAATLWLTLRRHDPATPERHVAEQKGGQPLAPDMKPTPPQPETDRSAGQQKNSAPPQKAQRPPHSPRTPKPRASDFDYAGAAAEGERAKEQLLLALHVASEKLNAAQKKIRQPGEPQS